MAVSASAMTKLFPFSLRSFAIELVTSMSISDDSSISCESPKYPILFSVKLVEDTSLTHSICPKWVGYPSRLKNNNFAMFLFLCSQSFSYNK